jgi:hypothetical protein
MTQRLTVDCVSCSCASFPVVHSHSKFHFVSAASADPSVSVSFGV